MTLLSLILYIGIPVIAGALIYIGRKLQILDDLQKKVETIYDRFIRTEERVETLWQDKFAPTNSPRQLNPRGESILETSGIVSIVERFKADITQELRLKSPKTAYDAEQCLTDIISHLASDHPEVLESIKQGAFKSGESIDAVLFVAAIHFRDPILKEVGFDPADIR